MRGFIRAAAMLAAFAAIQNSTQLAPQEKRNQISDIGPYQSRGKGGKSPRTFSGVARARRAAQKARNKAS